MLSVKKELVWIAPVAIFIAGMLTGIYLSMHDFVVRNWSLNQTTTSISVLRKGTHVPLYQKHREYMKEQPCTRCHGDEEDEAN